MHHQRYGSFVAYGASVLLSLTGGMVAIAQPVDSFNSVTAMDQMLFINELSDVQPTDWAFQALQSLVERYGCVVGYPDGTYRGERALTRYEFAVALNSCLDRVNELMITETTDVIQREELEIFQVLQQQFAQELSILQGQLNTLESQINTLENQQFSPTTTLNGISILGIQGRSINQADRNPRDGERETSDPGSSIYSINLNYLLLSTFFTPRSYLFMTLLTIQGEGAPRLTNDDRVAYDFGEVSDFLLADLNYRFLVTDRLAAFVGTNGVRTATAFREPNRIESAALGPTSFFAQRNPILNIGLGDTGAGFDWQVGRRVSLQGVFSSTSPTLAQGHNTTAFQLALTPIDPIDLAFYYVNDYSPNGFLISFVGDDQLTVENPITDESAPLKTHGVGATLTWQVSPKVTLGGWFGYTNSHIPGESGNVETTNYMVFLNLPDLGGEGNLAGLYVGQPPKIISSNLPSGNNIPASLGNATKSGGHPGTTTHIEAFYRWPMSDHIYITPGAVLILQPGHTPDSDPMFMGILRTTFLF